MSPFQFWRTILLNCLLVTAVNGLFYWPGVKGLLSQTPLAVLLGLTVYAAQLAVTYYSLGNQRRWLTEPFRKKAIQQGLGAVVVVQLIVVALLVGLSVHTPVPDLASRVVSFLPVFLLNALPGALLEEWLFRYLPFRFGRQSPKRYSPILFCLALLILFTVIHLPAYLFQYGLGPADLGRVFAMGLFFLTVYLTTRNVFFTAFIHALTNTPLYLIDSPFYWVYFYASVLLVSGVWAALRFRNQRKTVAA